MSTYSPCAEFTKFVVIESLRVGERRTGEEIAHGIKLHLANAGELVPVEFHRCATRSEFSALLSVVLEQSSSGQIPMLHIECHGDEKHGIEFSNGERMSWPALAEQLAAINVETGFNLMVLVSACFGAHFASMITAVRTSPCWALVAPSHEVFPSELEAGFIEFYGAFVREWDLGVALRALRGKPLSRGAWQAALAEEWFHEIFVGYIRTYCTRDVIERRTFELQAERGRLGLPWAPQCDMRHYLRVQNSLGLEKYFSRFFATDLLPGNAARFEPVKNAARLEVEELRHTGDYVL